MRYLLGPLLALLLATPAHAVQITQVALNCAGDRLPAGVTVHTLTCMGQGLWLGATVGGFPVETDPTIRFALTVNGVELGSLLHTLPAHLGPVFGEDWHEYSSAGVAWRLPLDALCAVGCTGEAVASIALIGGSDPDVAFTLAVPTPEPATLLMVGTTLALIGWRMRRRQ